MEIPKFGFMTDPSKDILKEIKKGLRLGFDFVEIGIEPPLGTPEHLKKNEEKILDILNKNKTFAIAHTAWWVELGSFHEPVRKAWVVEGKKAIDAANELGIKEINFHAQTYPLTLSNRKSRRQTIQNLIKSSEELVDYAARFNIGVMIENQPQRKSFEPNDFKQIFRGVKGLGFHFDVGHAFIGGGMKGVEKYIKAFRDRLWHIHLHDNHGEHDEHLPIGEGSIDFRKVVKSLKKVGYKRTITLEVFSTEKRVKESLKRIKRIWREA
jgi:sugar phosphate isomerase/epimerase